VEAAARDASAARDEAASLRLQQRILTEYGRPDLAIGLDGEVARKEEDARTLAHTLADLEAAQAFYRDYAARIGASIPTTPAAGLPTAAARATPDNGAAGSNRPKHSTAVRPTP
jgi:hypothetical protein